MLIVSTALAKYAAHWLALRALCIAVWAAMGPGSGTPDAPEIAEAIATSVLEQDAPTLESLDADAAVLAVFARGESGLRRAPRPESWDAVAHVSCGVWQQRCAWLAPSILGQARAEIELLRRGAVLCPESPAAPLSGGCHGAGRRLADGRVTRARALLSGQVSPSTAPSSPAP